MTIHELASLLCKKEGKRSQVKRGDMLEILKALVELDADIAFEKGAFKGPLVMLIGRSVKRFERMRKKKRT